MARCTCGSRMPKSGILTPIRPFWTPRRCQHDGPWPGPSPQAMDFLNGPFTLKLKTGAWYYYYNYPAITATFHSSPDEKMPTEKPPCFRVVFSASISVFSLEPLCMFLHFGTQKPGALAMRLLYVVQNAVINIAGGIYVMRVVTVNAVEKMRVDDATRRKMQ